VLAPEGIFLCSTPNRALTNPGKTLAGKPWNKFHLREYDDTGFRQLLGQYFSRIELYGQNPASRVRAGLLRFCGQVLPGHGAVYASQMLKLPRFLIDKQAWHSVRRAETGAWEYLAAVCRA